jgi:eukaryotic-like serine/threonine-protein kinase
MQLTPGTQLGPYRVLHLIGIGGMGEVYAAEDLRLRRTIALKILPSDIACDRERVARFQREAQAIAAISHPSIVTIHSVEEADGIPFITMELVEGRTLNQLIPSEGFEIDAVLQLSVALAAAIAAAHQRGITHRDLKPANVIVTAAGTVKVLDFGLAKLQRPPDLPSDLTTQGRADETAEGRFIGTVAYMSPEQAQGGQVDQRTDIFSIGVMLYEMTVGERPFKGDTQLSILSAILRETPRPLSELKPVTPPDLDRIVRRCLQKDPSLRYQTAADLASDLANARQKGRNHATSEVRPSASRKVHRYVAATLVIVAAAALVVWRLPDSAALPTPVAIDHVRRLTAGGDAALAAVSGDGRYVAHIKNGGGRPSLWVRQVATESDLQIVAPADVRYAGVTYSWDGNHVLYVTYPKDGEWGTLFRVPALGGKPQRVLYDIDSGPAVAPTSGRIAFIRYVVSAEGVRSQLVVADSSGNDQRILAAFSDQNSLLPVRPS